MSPIVSWHTEIQIGDGENEKEWCSLGTDRISRSNLWFQANWPDISTEQLKIYIFL